MSQSRELHGAGFPQFKLLPPELQLKVWEEVILTAEKPRIVLLNAEECPISEAADHWDDLISWRIRVDNSEELSAESRSAVARNLSGVCSTSRYVATRSRDQLQGFNPPEYCPALMNLGLCLFSDVFWIPDDIEQFLQTRQLLTLRDEHYINCLMISLHSLETLVRLAAHPDSEIISSLLAKLIRSFSCVNGLIVMVNVPRGHVSWDQTKVAGVNVAMGVEDDRCNSVFQTYEATHDNLFEAFAIALAADGLDPLGASQRVWPELSFAFRKPA